jgi:NADPH:quinone reductase-like Zn-dependent oxidoreductase
VTSNSRELGADRVIDYKKQRFEEIARDIDLVFDLVDAEIQDRSFAVLKPSGRLISTLRAPDKGKLAERGLQGSHYMAQPSGAQLAEIARLIDEGKVRVVVSRIYPLEQAGTAQQILEREHPPGKVVLKVAA